MNSSPYCAVSEPNVYKHYKRLTRWNAKRCFETSYMKQNKSRKQTLESAQYGLEISFNRSTNDYSNKQRTQKSRQEDRNIEKEQTKIDKAKQKKKKTNRQNKPCSKQNKEKKQRPNKQITNQPNKHTNQETTKHDG